MNIIAILTPYIDYNYRTFQQKICFTKYEILGVKVPILRNIAKRLVKEYSIEEIMDNLPFDYFESIMLKGLSIAYSKTSYEEKIILINNFLPLIDNWAICDIFAGSLKFSQGDLDKFLTFINTILKRNEEYYLRFGIVMLLNNYLNKDYIDATLDKLIEIKNDKYYVKMAISWAYSISFVKDFEKTKDFFLKKKDIMDKWIYQKALQKALESFRISEEKKKILREMKKLT